MNGKSYREIVEARREIELKEIRSLTKKERLRVAETLLSEIPLTIPAIKDRSTPVALSMLLKRKKRPRAK